MPMITSTIPCVIVVAVTSMNGSPVVTGSPRSLGHSVIRRSTRPGLIPLPCPASGTSMLSCHAHRRLQEQVRRADRLVRATCPLLQRTPAPPP
jgi:hypothetical protein